MSADCGSLLTIGVFFIFIALLAYFKELRLSSTLLSAGLIQAIIYVLEFPPKQSCSIRVSLELRKVMNWSCFLSMVANAEITLPNYSRPRLMFIP
jgi:hypothetical protein